jgi:hypothetical protein
MLLAVTDDNERHFGHHCCWRASPISIKHRGQHKLIIFYIKFMILLKLVDCGVEKICGRPSAPPAAWIHQIHAAGGASGAITMVMVFVRSLCFLCGFRLVTYQLDSSYLCFRGVTKCPTQACTIPQILCWVFIR